MIDVQDLSVAIGPVQILDRVSLRVEPGTTVGVVGHNGAGKTTLMRALIGLLPASAGHVSLCGRDVTGMETQDRVRLGIGYMPEDRRLVPDLSVRQNILLPLEVARRRDADAALQRVLEWIPELVPLIDRKGNQLSGGQQKLAALARAICSGTHILLLDEPFEGVAPALVQRLAGVLRELRASGPAILVTDSEGAHLHGLCDARYDIERGSLSVRRSEVIHDE
jgi:branched-chain amino acid transport system ATP-binding protein